MLNCDCYIAILELCAKKKSSGSFKNVINKVFTNHIFNICINIWH